MQKRCMALLIALLAIGIGSAAAQERFGGLTGAVTDPAAPCCPARR